MDSAKNNPSENKLRSGISDEMVMDAIIASGYPLQLQVANDLKKHFYLQEEWAFSDIEGHTTRTIDILATERLYDLAEPQPRARPSLNLVIECKQSDLPYIFFLSGSKPWLRDFPLIGGLKSRHIGITSDDDPSTWNLDPIMLFELHQHEFLTKAAPTCMTFSKCARKGSDLQLSGSDAYQGLVFPLIKASRHLERCMAPPPTAHYFDCELIIPLAVVDAPMIGVSLNEATTENQLLPWVRVVRHQPIDNNGVVEQSTTMAIDVVHKNFLDTYINQHVRPFARSFATLALKHHEILADGKGFAPGMGKESWGGIESRIAPISTSPRGARAKAVIKRLAESLSNQSGDASTQP